MKPVLLLSLLITAGFCACGKQQSAPPAVSPATREPIAPAPPAPGVTLPSGHVIPTGLKEFESSVVLADLNKNLKIFVLQKQRMPASLEELARDGGMPIPTPPAGVKLVLDAKSQSVKVVPQ